MGKKIVKLTESDLNRLIKRTIMEMDDEMVSSETDHVSKGSEVIQSFMRSIADLKPYKQVDAIDEMISQLKIYKTNLTFGGAGNPNAR
jgi:hypothetical protein